MTVSPHRRPRDRIAVPALGGWATPRAPSDTATTRRSGHRAALLLAICVTVAAPFIAPALDPALAEWARPLCWIVVAPILAARLLTGIECVSRARVLPHEVPEERRS